MAKIARTYTQFILWSNHLYQQTKYNIVLSAMPLNYFLAHFDAALLLVVQLTISLKLSIYVAQPLISLK